jgi:hypothetical protein
VFHDHEGIMPHGGMARGRGGGHPDTSLRSGPRVPAATPMAPEAGLA